MQKLKKFLTAEKLNQDEFAVIVNTTPATMSRVIRGKQPPSLELAVAIEDATKGKVRCKDWIA